MLRLWPPIVPVGHHDDASPNSEATCGLNESACFSRQVIQLEPQPGGWKITVDSVVETGRLELFVPQNRDEPARIVSDTRNQSTFLSFAQLFSGGHYTEAAFVAEHELELARKSVAQDGNAGRNGIRPETRSLVGKLQQVAMARQRKGDYDRAEAALNEAIAICELAPRDYPDALIPLLHMRLCIRYFNRPTDDASSQDSRREMDRLRQRSEQLLGREHPETTRIMTSQARLLISEFSYFDAEELLKEAIRIQTKALGADCLEVSESLLELARLNAFEEKHDEADVGFKQALEIREAKCGPDHPDVADVLFHYTDFLIYNRGDGARAGALLRRAMKIWSETIGLDHSSVVKESGFIRKVLAVDAESASPGEPNSR